MEKNVSKIFNLSDSRFRVILLLLRCGGMSVRVKNISKIRLLYNNIINISSYVNFSLIVIDMIVNRDDLLHLTTSIRIVLIAIMVLCQAIYIRFKPREIERLINLSESFVWEDMPTRDPVTGKLTSAGWIPRVQEIIKLVIYLAVVLTMAQTGSKIITSRTLMFDAWYPFDVSTSPMFEFVSILQVIFALHYIFVYYFVPGLYVTFVFIAMSQLEKLKQNLLEIKQMRLMNEQYETTDQNQMEVHSKDQAMWCHMQRKLNDCVRLHQKIIEFMNEMEKSLNIVFFAIFLLASIGMCGSAFTAVLNWGEWLPVSEAAVCYIVLIGTLFLYCSFGTKLTEQVESLKHAAIGCDWVGTPVTFQRCLVFMIAACNREFTLTAGKFVPVSNETMMNMVNQSMSLFMFLLQVKEGNDRSEEIK